MEGKYDQGFSVPQLLFNAAAGAIWVADSYTDFAAKVIAAIEPEVIQKIATDLGLSFVPQKEKEGEVCFINSEEVRPEFKLSFAPVDLSDYILAVLQHSSADQHKSLPETSRLNIPYPKGAVGFWELVKAGEQLRQMI